LAFAHPILRCLRIFLAQGTILDRAIGVVYRADTELVSHCFNVRLSDQFGAVLHFDHTRAVEPLERTAEREMGEVEETFPSGL
jgi:erythromycin esterase-like protein